MKRYLLLLIGMAAMAATAQVSRVLPEQPQAGESLFVQYDPAQPGAALKSGAPVWARVTCYLQNGGIEKFSTVLVQRGGKLESHFVLPAMAASVVVEFYTVNKDDNGARKKTPVYSRVNGKPVKGAYLADFFSNQADSLFRLETALYPGHFNAFARYINVISMTKPSVEALNLTKGLLAVMDSLARQTPAIKTEAGFLAAKSVGAAKMGDIQAAAGYCIQLLARHPNAEETAFAFSIYNYENYKAGNSKPGAAVLDALKKVYIQHPGAAICTDTNVFEYLYTDTGIPAAAFEKVIKPLMARNNLPYYALGSLPRLYIVRGEQPDSAKQMLLRAISHFQDGSIMHQVRLKSDDCNLYVAMLLLDLVKANRALGEPSAAVINSSAAMQLITGHNAEGNFLPGLLRLRAGGYEALGNLHLAMADYQELYLRGEAAALKDLERLFPLCAVNGSSFADFLNGLGHKKRPASGKNIIPDFTGTDMQGNTVNFSDLKGKIVVVNVWGIGCGPCIAEIPELNLLVNDYAGSNDVRFLAIAADRRESLQVFLKARKFDYRVINNVRNMMEAFNVGALPVHIVIGANGEVVSRSIGARPDIRAFLKSVIDVELSQMRKM